MLPTDDGLIVSAPVTLAALFRAGQNGGMKCDGCGQQFPGNESRHDTRCETRGKHSTAAKLITLCPSCADSRRNTFWFVLWTMLYLFVAIVVIASVLPLLNT
jgi:hypothetical protein